MPASHTLNQNTKIKHKLSLPAQEQDLHTCSSYFPVAHHHDSSRGITHEGMATALLIAVATTSGNGALPMALLTLLALPYY